MIANGTAPRRAVILQPRQPMCETAASRPQSLTADTRAATPMTAQPTWNTSRPPCAPPWPTALASACRSPSHPIPTASPTARRRAPPDTLPASPQRSRRRSQFAPPERRHHYHIPALQLHTLNRPGSQILRRIKTADFRFALNDSITHNRPSATRVTRHRSHRTSPRAHDQPPRRIVAGNPPPGDHAHSPDASNSGASSGRSKATTPHRSNTLAHAFPVTLAGTAAGRPTSIPQSTATSTARTAATDTTCTPGRRPLLDRA